MSDFGALLDSMEEEEEETTPVPLSMSPKPSFQPLPSNFVRPTNLPPPPNPIANSPLSSGSIDISIIPKSEKDQVSIERSSSGTFKKFIFNQENESDTCKRLRVLQEIIISEHDYVKDLSIIVQNFLQPLRASGCGSQDIPLIFGNIELIFSVNTELLRKLNEMVDSDNLEAGVFLIGNIFLEMSNNLLCYDQYIKNHKSAVNTLQRALKQTAFANEVDKCRNRMIGTGILLHLPDLLIKPIQRICKYPLLFQELIKSTPETHPDHENLVDALNKLEEIANKINDSKREAENMQTLVAIQRQIDGYDGKLAEAGRYFVKDGILQKMNPRGKIQSRQFFLFSDMLMWCKSKPSIAKKPHYQYKGDIRLNLAVVREPPDTKSVKNKFQIIKLDTKKIYDLIADSPESKKQWVQAIDELVNLWLETEKINKIERDEINRQSAAVSPAAQRRNPNEPKRTTAVPARITGANKFFQQPALSDTSLKHQGRSNTVLAPSPASGPHKLPSSSEFTPPPLSSNSSSAAVMSRNQNTSSGNLNAPPQIPVPEPLTPLSPLVISILDANQKLLKQVEQLRDSLTETPVMGVAPSAGNANPAVIITKDSLNPVTGYDRLSSSYTPPNPSDQIKNLEFKLNSLIVSNDYLTNRISDLERTISKQSKAIRSLKKAQKQPGSQPSLL